MLRYDTLPLLSIICPFLCDRL